MLFQDKIKKHRADLGLNQQQLADKIGVTKRSVAAYETVGVKPRGATMRGLAKALGVSVEYLMDEDITDPAYGLVKDAYMEQARERFGDKAARDMASLLEQNAAFFAGGSLEQDAKDAFFEAVMKAYLSCKEEARKTYGRKAETKS